MSSVLFEAGSIINRDEEVLMSDPKHQAVIGAAVTDAVEQFCATGGGRAGNIPAADVREGLRQSPGASAPFATPAVQ